MVKTVFLTFADDAKINDKWESWICTIKRMHIWQSTIKRSELGYLPLNVCNVIGFYHSVNFTVNTHLRGVPPPPDEALGALRHVRLSLDAAPAPPPVAGLTRLARRLPTRRSGPHHGCLLTKDCNNPKKIHTPKIHATNFLPKSHVMLSNMC